MIAGPRPENRVRESPNAQEARVLAAGGEPDVMLELPATLR